MKKFLPLIFLIFLFSCCHKDPVPIVRLIPDDLRAYWDFKPGTWWAYKDSVTGLIDTVKVTERTNYTFEGNLSYNDAVATCEYLQITTYNTGDEYTYKYWISTDASGSIPDFNVVFSDKYKTGDFIDTHKCFFYPYIEGFAIGQGYGAVIDTCKLKKKYDSILSFNAVLLFTNSFNSFEDYTNTESYYAKNIGLIRYEVPDSNNFKTLNTYFIKP